MARTFVFQVQTTLACPIDRTFAFFSDPVNLEAITPPWLKFRITSALPIRVREGTLIEYALRIRGFPVRWKTRIAAWEPPHRFVDEQVSGPYTLWRHEHTFEPDPHDPGATIMRDRVEYAFHGWWLSPLINAVYVARDVKKIFDYRSRRTAELLGPGPRTAATPATEPVKTSDSAALTAGNHLE
ncbi:MAG: hypothetical protein AMXMBFR58_09470 [Phycisphaerae bacterium]|nr:hypothetical protein [Phycisphaerales bacterium]